VLNVDHGYVGRPEDFQWLPGAREAVRYLNQAGYAVVVATNQSGIARGYYTEQDFLDLMAWVQEELARAGAHLDGVFYCPHHPEHGQGPYRRACTCRKPAPGLLLQALERLHGDPARSVLIGDRQGDMRAAERAGVRGVLFDGSRDLLDLVRKVVEEERREGRAP
jgi:D-glycero-D-manno-heptose 1,7-bisphosphate phosphatase